MAKRARKKEQFRVLIVYPNLSLMLVPSIAVGLLTRLMKGQGYEVDLFDSTPYISEENSSPQNRVKYLQARSFDEENDLGFEIKEDLLGDFRRKVEVFKPDLMLFSVVEDAFRQAVSMLETVADLDIPHILGGVFPTAAPQRCMDFSVIKMVGVGEGENIVIEVAKAIRLSRSLGNIPGIWYRDDTGAVHQNPMGPLVDITKVTPDFGLIDQARFVRPMGGRYFKTIPVETYRGCPYKCTFCNSPMQVTISRDNELGNYLRRKSMTSLRKELLDLIEIYHPEFFYFVDDSFLARPQQEIMDFCDMYQEIGLPFWFNTRPENCTKANIHCIREAGCYRISFGIECGNEEYRAAVLKRNVKNEKLIGQFDLIADSGISFSLNLIIGFPGETRELIMDTVNLVRSVRGYDTLTVSIFTPYYGTVLRDVAVKNGWLDSKTITKHTTSSSLLDMPPPYVSSQDIDGIMRVLPLYCYFGRSEWDRLRRAETDDEEGNEILKHYSEIYTKNFLKGTQTEKKDFVVSGGSGCQSNEKDAFRISPKRMNTDDIALLTMPS